MMDELGAGFYLAMHDLEIRGAGEVLGESQSGAMQEIGFNLFTEMLNRAVSRCSNRARSRTSAATGHRHRDQSAHAGAAAQRLRTRRPRATGALQAAGQLHSLDDIADAGRTGRSLRRTAAAGARRCSTATACACSASRSA
jgi:hypothetical protein